MGKKLRGHLVILALLAITSTGLLIQGGYMQAKAHFAQYLIAKAFEQTLQDDKPHKPWSWADTHPVAKMQFKDQDHRIKSDEIYVLAGVSGRTLAFGPGLYLNGAGVGEVGNTVIAGHRDTHFITLRQLQIGDKIEMVNSRSVVIEYTVTDLRIVDASAVDEMAITDDHRLTLITCYPFEGLTAKATQRFIVEAKAA